MLHGRSEVSPGRRIAMGASRVIAAIIVAVIISAALAELKLQPVEFARMLPIVLIGEIILYLIMLGGGTIAGPVLILTLVLALLLRAGIALCAAVLSPQMGGALIPSAMFYYAAYWPAAIAQIVLMLVLLRLMRPLIARRRRMRRPPPSPRTEDVLDDAMREALLAALEEAPDEPPPSPTVLEEMQIGDLADRPATRSAQELADQDLALPFDAAATEEDLLAAAELVEESSLPPGVVDATPEAMARAAAEQFMPAEAVADEIAEEEISLAEAVPAAEEQPVHEPAFTEATIEAPTDQQPATVTTEPPPTDVESAAAVEVTLAAPLVMPHWQEPPAIGHAPGEDTAPFEPIASDERDSVAPAVPQDLREMIEVIANAAGEGAEVRVWGTSDGRTIIAAVPAGTPAAATAAHADALVRAHFALGSWMPNGASTALLASTPLGAYALQPLDASGSLMLLLSARGAAAAGRLDLTVSHAVAAIRGLAQPSSGLIPAASSPEMVPLRADLALTARAEDAVSTVGSQLAVFWSAFRRIDRRPVLIASPPGVDPEQFGRVAAAAADAIEGFTDALALDEPAWLTITAGESLLALVWETMGTERALVAGMVENHTGLGRVRWELSRVAQVLNDALTGAGR